MSPRFLRADSQLVSSWLGFVPFGWSLIAISEKAITANIKMLLRNWRHCTRGRKLVAPLYTM